MQTKENHTIARELGRFVSQTRYKHLSADTAAAIKIRILDLLGVSLLGAERKVHQRLLPILNSPGEVTVWGTQERRSCRDAVLLNTFAASALYLEDGSRHTGGHPSSAVIPAAISLAELRAANGRRLIAAVAAGYEVFLRLGHALYPATVKRGFKSTAVLGAVSSAATCANLLGLGIEASTHALAISANLGIGLKEALECSESEPLQGARSSEAGLMAALFAQAGAKGSDMIFERGFLPVFADGASSVDLTNLGLHFSVAETYIKLHAGCRGNHAPIDVLQHLIRIHGVHWDDIKHIDVRVDSVTYQADIHNPLTIEQAQFSVAFSLAVAWIKGSASIFEYVTSNLSHPDIRRFMEKVHTKPDTSLDGGFPQSRGAAIDLFMKDGKHFRGQTDLARGEPETPLSEAEIVGKFLLSSTLLHDAAPSVARDILKLEASETITSLAKQLASTRRPTKRTTLT